VCGGESEVVFGIGWSKEFVCECVQVKLPRLSIPLEFEFVETFLWMPLCLAGHSIRQ
jgi:hypothetical protein